MTKTIEDQISKNFILLMNANREHFLAKLQLHFNVRTGFDFISYGFLSIPRKLTILKRVVPQNKNYLTPKDARFFEVEIKQIGTGKAVQIYIIPALKKIQPKIFGKIWSIFLIVSDQDGYRTIMIKDKIAPILKVKSWQNEIKTLF